MTGLTALNFNDFDKLFVGFDRLHNQLANRVTDYPITNYPRYNLVAIGDDAYRIEYLDEANSWVSAWEIPIVGGYGMQTRPNTFDNTEVFALPTAIKTNRLRFTAVSGDGFYSVSEIQALGSVVPEPSTGAMCAIALILLLGARMFQMRSYTVVSY